MSEVAAGEMREHADIRNNQQLNLQNQSHSSDNLLQKLLPAGIDPDTLLIGAMILLLLSEHGEVSEPDDDLLLLLGLLLFVR